MLTTPEVAELRWDAMGVSVSRLACGNLSCPSIDDRMKCIRSRRGTTDEPLLSVYVQCVVLAMEN